MNTQPCHALILKCAAACTSPSAQSWFDTIKPTLDSEATLQSVFTPQAENGLPLQYVYVRFTKAIHLHNSDCTRYEEVWYGLTGHAAQISRLHEVMHLETSHAESIMDTAHYVVETDTEQGWETEIFKWYDEEHLQGLARVPGCKAARRYLNLDHSPRSFACYDLLNPDVLNSDPWLAVRASAWSDICRPHFTNTRRTLFEVQELDHHD